MEVEQIKNRYILIRNKKQKTQEISTEMNILLFKEESFVV